VESVRVIEVLKRHNFTAEEMGRARTPEFVSAPIGLSEKVRYRLQRSEEIRNCNLVHPDGALECCPLRKAERLNNRVDYTLLIESRTSCMLVKR
jgi:hypothetical protein